MFSVQFTVFLPHLEKNHEVRLPFPPVISGAPLGSRASFLSEPHRPTSCRPLPTEVSRLFSVVTMQVWFALETAHASSQAGCPLPMPELSGVERKQFHSCGHSEMGRLFASLGRCTAVSEGIDALMSGLQSLRNLTALSKPVLGTEVRYSEMHVLSLFLTREDSYL